MANDPVSSDNGKQTPKAQTADEFLLQKEIQSGQPITPRIRELFYKRLKLKKTNEEAWKSIYGD
ncbi:hypothetical protein LEP1GSC050_0103 [Leptospira phage vB_LbrZ_5399-LE1]|uniref:Toxin-antitoxin system, antitoxin component, ribbon-helix-helix domain protein n=1 Tax=Leptospira inadai serovar Lyme TaxID=293084 RepID=A0ABX4YGI0_9LEPT|nr:hypothetical protein [Leptospira inadai]AGS80722.1 hypothetical protein LEP1GSC050_0103 [Leptospira phage vB_LbrZ_5399-LE1]AGS80836.1 hypothetical protein LEP1GSC047_0869 [Leptospira phage vB_LinZ_10-LE1]PNV74361.1 hypothetical protein BES34_014350 [Leptospira inadai serovar Lyme]